MEIMHITKASYSKIVKAAEAVSSVETGSRNAYITKNGFVIKTLPAKARKCANLPKKFGIVFCTTENLGTNKWPQIVRVYDTVYANEGDYRETDKCIIVGGRRIQKDHVLAFVW